MQNSTAFLLDLLRNKIKNRDDRLVPVIKRSYPLDKSPCICLDDSGGSTILQKYRMHKPHEVLYEYIESNINIHLYCDEENERDYLLNEIQQAVYNIESDNYTYCTQYSEGGICKTIGKICPTLKNTTARTIKGQCIKPNEYNYRSLYQKHGVVKESVLIHPAFSIDDLSKHPVLLHSVIKTSMVYIKDYHLNGKLSEYLIDNTIIINNKI